MASYKFRIFFFAALLLSLLSVQSVRAQGNDFPFYPNVPPWNQPVIPAPVPGFDYNPGSTAWGPQTLWGVQKGSTVVFDLVLDWWGLGPLSLSPQSNNAQNMRWNGPNTRAGQWYHPGIGFWCLRCEFQFEAGDDNPDLWIAFMGSEQFGVHAEIKQVIPPPQSFFSVLSDPDKSTAQGFSNFLFGFSGVMAGFSQVAQGFDIKTSIVSGLVAYGSALIGSHYQNIAHDPWDGDYCSPTQFSYNPQTIQDINWAREHDDVAYQWTIASIELIDGYGIQAYQAANRALSAASVGDMDCAWARRSEAIGAINQMGGWMYYFRLAVEVDANAYSSDEMRQSLDALTNIMNWSLGVQ